jgi:hypothetical protein
VQDDGGPTDADITAAEEEALRCMLENQRRDRNFKLHLDSGGRAS